MLPEQSHQVSPEQVGPLQGPGAPETGLTWRNWPLAAAQAGFLVPVLERERKGL